MVPRLMFGKSFIVTGSAKNFNIVLNLGGELGLKFFGKLGTFLDIKL